VIGATAGTSYTVRVVAHYASGDSDASAASNSATPTGPTVPGTTPTSAPTTLTTKQGAIGVVTPGSALTVVGTGFAPNSTVTILMYSSPTKLGTATTDADGNLSHDVTVPTLDEGLHNIVASGVTPSGATHLMRLPVTMVHKTEPDATIPIPAGGRVRLINAAGHEVTKVTVDKDEGSYSLNTSSGLMTFTAAGAFEGTADAVTYRATDHLGTKVEGTYSADVATKPGNAGVPVKSRTTSTAAGTITVPCTISHGKITKCVVTVTAVVNGKTVVVGRATVSSSTGKARVSVPVTLTAAGRALIRQAGGAKLTVTAVVTQAGRSGTTTATRTTTVHGTSPSFTVARRIEFNDTVIKLNAVQKAFLKSLRPQLGGAKTITCTGGAEMNVEGNHTRAKKFATERAENVCAVLAAGLDVQVKIVPVAHPWLGGRHDNATERQADRTVRISVS
jgi:CshA-type fibril repeat protein